MKKSLKILLIIAFIATLLLTLTGCGNKLVATKTTNEDGTEYNEKLEISFKKDKIDKVKWTYTFENEEDAETMKGYSDLMFAFFGEDVEGLDIEQNGKKIIMKLDEEMFAKMEGNDSEVSKEELKEELEEEGYTVK